MFSLFLTKNDVMMVILQIAFRNKTCVKFTAQYELEDLQLKFGV